MSELSSTGTEKISVQPKEQALPGTERGLRGAGVIRNLLERRRPDPEAHAARKSLFEGQRLGHIRKDLLSAQATSQTGKVAESVTSQSGPETVAKRLTKYSDEKNTAWAEKQLKGSPLSTRIDGAMDKMVSGLEHAGEYLLFKVGLITKKQYEELRDQRDKEHQFGDMSKVRFAR